MLQQSHYEKCENSVQYFDDIGHIGYRLQSAKFVATWYDMIVILSIFVMSFITLQDENVHEI